MCYVKDFFQKYTLLRNNRNIWTTSNSCKKIFITIESGTNNHCSFPEVSRLIFDGKAPFVDSESIAILFYHYPVPVIPGSLSSDIIIYNRQNYIKIKLDPDDKSRFLLLIANQGTSKLFNKGKGRTDGTCNLSARHIKLCQPNRSEKNLY